MKTIASFWNRAWAARGAVLLAAAVWAAPAAAEDIQVVKSGKYLGAVQSYQVGGNFYLAAKEAARIYGGQLYWYSVRGEVRLSLRGQQIWFKTDSETVEIMGKPMALPRPMIVRASQAFIPIEFFAVKAFSDVAGVDSKFNPSTRLLLVDQRSNVGPLRWFTYADHTRIVLEIAEDLRFHSTKRGRYGFEIDIPNGTIDWSEKTDINDGVVEYLHLYQDSRQARLVLKQQAAAAGMRVREFKQPRRIVIDVDRAQDSVVEARRSRVAVEAPEPHGGEPGGRAESAAGGDAGAGLGAAMGAGAIRLVKNALADKPSEPSEPSPPASSEKPALVPPPVKAPGVYRIVIDAGHGGRDGGAVGRRGTLEKEINLLTAQELASLLREEGMFDVMLTREKDVFVRLGDRSSFANKHSADLFISLHCNAHASRAESGYEIYFLSERASDPEAERLAEFENSVLALEVEDAVEDRAASVLYRLAKHEDVNDAAELAGRMAQSLTQRVDLPNRGVKQASFYVLRGANAPAVLVETAFLSNAKDEAKLQSQKYRRKIVEGLYAGIVEHVRQNSRQAGDDK
ncbi:MAG: N-acetylmuramoyl-L-alanine amidase [Elusimicrobiota bacterium]